MISQLILKIDQLIEEQVQVIVEDSYFQELRNRWVGLMYLVENAESTQNIKIKLLNVSWANLCLDLGRHTNIENSTFFYKVYHSEFGHAGGEPYGLLIGDYEINIHNCAHKDLYHLKQLAEIANVSFLPIILALSSKSFGYSSFKEYDSMVDINQLVSHRDYSQWRNFRNKPASKFIALSLPKILLNEFVETKFKRSEYYKKHLWIWCNANYSIAAVIMHDFSETNWFCDLTGINNKSVNAGLIPKLKSIPFDKYATIKVYRALSEFVVSEHQEKQFSDLGFIPVCQLSNSNSAYFLSMQSMYSSINMNDLSNNISYLLCVCRFAHYLKLIGRNIIGSYTNPSKCQQELRQWLMQYVASNPDLPEELQYQFPLKKADVSVSLQQGYQDKYLCKFLLSPNLRVNQSVATIMLTTEIYKY